MRSATPARTTAALAVAVLLTAGLAGAADAAKGGGGKGGKGPKGGTTTTSTTTTLTGSSAIQAAQADVCPKVAEYTSCSALGVTIANFGSTGWAGYSHPANDAVDYNTYYTVSQAQWANIVAHEVGGHIDAWNEIVAKVGVTQAWTDYYDLDYFGAQWATARWSAVKGTSRTFSTGEGKEAYLDCAGPVAHGYQGNYLYSWGMTTASSQQSFCQGAAGVMTDALTTSRP